MTGLAIIGMCAQAFLTDACELRVTELELDDTRQCEIRRDRDDPSAIETM